ncbi:hypothetical protein PR048_009402 [Dryococelus australis]|uniref:Uncharacterized protein n=1 Tax=Dryococelus australis TaxID=614101 RepID=A0ABQ9I060_9NEOP|nr:hypothetical protein PR048_009402 [Dryococelus australis]
MSTYASIEYPPAYPQFVSKTARMASYGLWPKSSKNNAEEMCDAGFFYTGKDDRELCFVCGGGLCDWEEDDNPWTEHLQWFPRLLISSFEEGDDIISDHRHLSPFVLNYIWPEEKYFINVLPQRKPFSFPERYKSWEKSTTEYPSANSEYSSNTVRMASYGPCPKSAKKNAEEM